MQQDIDFEDRVPDPEIDVIQMCQQLWRSRKFILKWVGIGIVVGLIIAFSIHKEYTSTIDIAPEISESKSGGGGLSSLAAMAGINLSGNSSDAINPMIYPDILGSEPFNVGLFDVKVTTRNNNTETVREFIENDTHDTWWAILINLPLKGIGKVVKYVKGEHDTDDDLTHVTDPYRLTFKETTVVRSLKERININVDNKTGIISVSVTMQDPVVATMLADSVVARLKDYVTDYRTNKARNDLEYAQLLYNEAQAEYHRAQRVYANYIDRNHNITLQSKQVEADRLQNEAELAFAVYNQTAQQLQLAKAKVQEMSPVYTVIKPATVPIKPVKPKKLIILIAYAFVGFAIAAFWVLYGRDLWHKLKAR